MLFILFFKIPIVKYWLISYFKYYAEDFEVRAARVKSTSLLFA